MVPLKANIALAHIFFSSRVILSLALSDLFFLFVFVAAEKGAGDLVSIEWCQQAMIFMACLLVRLTLMLLGRDYKLC